MVNAAEVAMLVGVASVFFGRTRLRRPEPESGDETRFGSEPVPAVEERPTAGADERRESDAVDPVDRSP